jgi:hypothetical protein
MTLEADLDAVRVVSRNADRVANLMPLSHFPAREPFEKVREWVALVPPSQRGKPPSGDPLQDVRDENVFLSAGPPCYAIDANPPGNMVAYFCAWCECGGRAQGDVELRGKASPFDSGALGNESEAGCLMPVAAQSVEERLTFLEHHSVDVAHFRAMLGRWLEHCYGSTKSETYLEATTEPEHDGEPERTVPLDLLQENGARGTKPCADRRAWTWEVRLPHALPWKHLAALHVAYEHTQLAEEWSARVKLREGAPRLVVKALPRDSAGPDEFYVRCGDVLSTLYRQAQP